MKNNKVWSKKELGWNVGTLLYEKALGDQFCLRTVAYYVQEMTERVTEELSSRDDLDDDSVRAVMELNPGLTAKMMKKYGNKMSLRTLKVALDDPGAKDEAAEKILERGAIDPGALLDVFRRVPRLRERAFEEIIAFSDLALVQEVIAQLAEMGGIDQRFSEKAKELLISLPRTIGNVYLDMVRVNS